VRNIRAPRTATVTSVVARTVALRGDALKRASSPKYEPGSSVPVGLPPVSIAASPSRSTKKASPDAPSRTIVLPAPTVTVSTWRAIVARDRFVQRAKSGISANSVVSSRRDVPCAAMMPPISLRRACRERYRPVRERRHVDHLHIAAVGCGRSASVAAPSPGRASDTIAMRSEREGGA
jgi:hypothetical protein